MPDDRRINLRFPPERFEKMEQKRSRERLTFQDIGLRLFENWLAAGADQVARSDLRRPAHPYMERLAVLLSREDEALVGMVKKSIDVAWAVLYHSIGPEQIEHLRAVAYGEAPKPPKRSSTVTEPRKRGRPRKTA